MHAPKPPRVQLCSLLSKSQSPAVRHDNRQQQVCVGTEVSLREQWVAEKEAFNAQGSLDPHSKPVDADTRLANKDISIRQHCRLNCTVTAAQVDKVQAWNCNETKTSYNLHTQPTMQKMALSSTLRSVHQ